MITVGNDIVDLRAADAVDKWRDRRFMERVFSRSQCEEILRAPDRDRALWSHWAAREAAYKAGKRLAAPVSLSWNDHPDFVHCSAIQPGTHTQVRIEACNLEIAGTLTEREMESTSGYLPSIKLRLLAKRELEMDGVEIVRDKVGKKWGPPYVILHGKTVPEIALSFSHDGEWLALIIAWSSQSCRTHSASHRRIRS